MLVFKQNLKRIMHERGLSQGQVSQGSGVSKGTLNRYISVGAASSGSPNVANVEALAKFLRVSPAWLLFGYGDKNTTAEDVKSLLKAPAVTIPCYRLNAIDPNGLRGEPYKQVAVPLTDKDCFAVDFTPMYYHQPFRGFIAIVNDKVSPICDELILGAIAGDAEPSIYRFRQFGSVVHLWYRDLEKREPHVICDRKELRVMGVIHRGTWSA